VKPPATLFALVAAVATATLVLGLAALVEALGRRPLELAQTKTLALDPELVERLATLDGECHATYYVSARTELPSELRRLEADVTDVLEELARASNGHFHYRVVDPAASPELASWIAHQGIAPFRARSVRHDAWSETEIHSTLALAYAGHGRARIEGLRPEHVPSLAQQILAHLDEMTAPTTPRFAVAGRHVDALAEHLRATGDVSRVDFDADPGALPSDTDLFFWIAPEEAEHEHVRALEVFLEDGGSVVLAGSTHRLELDAEARPPILSHAQAAPIATVAAEFGLQAAPEPLLDATGGRLMVAGRSWSAPWRIPIVAPNQDFRPLGEQPNGTLFFDSPTAWIEDPLRLDELGYDAHTLATSSSRTWTQSLARPTPVDELVPENGETTGKSAVAMLAEPRDPWRGRLVLCGSASPFQNEEFTNDEFVHGALTDVLARTLASSERRVLRRSRPAASTPLPALEPRARILWRVVAIGSLPVLLGAIALLRWRFEGAGPRRARPRLGRRRASAVAGLVLVTVAVGALAPWLDATGLRLDWTRDSVHELSPATRALARGLDAPLRAELAFSSPLPPRLRVGLSRLRGRLDDLERAGLELDVATISVDDLALDERSELAKRGFRPLRVARRSASAASVRTLYAALALATDDARTVLEFPNELAFERLELRLAIALWTLEHGRPPRVAFAADLPQLTPAEAHVEYRQKGLFAPSGTDVYGLAKELLRLCGFDVVHVDPRAPALLDGSRRPDLLLWMQPRRPIEPMLARLVEHLRAGGNAALCAQHYVMRSRQPEEAGLEVRHWPEPQFTDLERGWLADLGLLLERTVLFDRRAGAATVTSKVDRSGGATSETQSAAVQPYLIRAVADNWATDPIVDRLGDVLFASASRLVVDPDRLADEGLAARTLARTSDEAWTHAWSGGDLPAEVLAGPDPLGEPAPRSALWVELAGSFPPLEADSRGPAAGPAAPAPPARLAVVGTSRPFENDLLFASEYDHASLLVNLVADLAVGPELGAVAARRSEPRGFAPPDDRTRWTLRAVVLAAGPVGFLLIAGTRRLRRRPSIVEPAR